MVSRLFWGLVLVFAVTRASAAHAQGECVCDDYAYTVVTPTVPALFLTAIITSTAQQIDATTADVVASSAPTLALFVEIAERAPSLVRVVRIASVHAHVRWIVIAMLYSVIFRAACAAVRFVLRNAERIAIIGDFVVGIVHAIRTAITDLIELFTPCMIAIALAMLTARVVGAQSPTPTPKIGRASCRERV